MLWPLNVILLYEQFHSAIISWPLLLGLVSGLAFGISYVVISTPVSGLVYGLGLCFVFGLLSGLFFAAAFNLLLGLFFGLAYGLVIGLILDRSLELDVTVIYEAPFLDIGLLDRFYYRLVSSLALRLVSGSVIGLIIFLLFSLGSKFGLGLGCVIGLPSGILAAYGLRSVLKGALDAIKAVFTPWKVDKFSILGAVIFFLIIYVLVVLIFSVWFFAFYKKGVWEQHPSYSCSEKIGTPKWWHFCYFSFVTIATIGYGDISPIRFWPQFFVFLEHIFGVGLIAGYLALVLQAPGRLGMWSASDVLQAVEQDQGLSREKARGTEAAYVASKNSDVFHLVSCQWAAKITETNRAYFQTSQEAIGSGRRQCVTCKPKGKEGDESG